MIRLYNSLTGKTEEFVPINKDEVAMYVCGSTVYDDMHIGNSRPIIFFDVVARFLTYIGYRVKLVSNFTDIDDKIIKKAQDENTTENEIADRYMQSILQTYQKLNILPHYQNPKVTETIPQIIDFIQLLIQRKGAYTVNGDVYFSVETVDDYGVLSGQNKDSLIVGSRIEENEKKRNPIDFNLWKSTNQGLRWDSPWGMGRPGWHTECVVMIQSIFKNKIDIHGGGSDLKFPHHDNEIAQSEVAYHHHLANYWMHNGRVDLHGEKMSKSLGNVIWAHELVDEIGYPTYRLMMMNVPYRQPLSYRSEVVQQAIADYDKIYRSHLALKRKLQFDFQSIDENCPVTNPELQKIKDNFIEAMSDDFNTANAITQIHQLVKITNQTLRQKECNADYLKQLAVLYHDLLWILGMLQEIVPLKEKEVELVQNWIAARNRKDFARADQLREEISHLGIIV